MCINFNFELSTVSALDTSYIEDTTVEIRIEVLTKVEVLNLTLVQEKNTSED